MKIGAHQLKNPVILAPMAGITDRPFREICSQFGVAMTVSEMVSANPCLRNHPRTVLKADHSGENGIRCVQILGTDPRQMAEAARYNVDRGADIIDINMGCPAKKVCALAAGSALLKDEKLVGKILHSVSNAVTVPVTLKIRTGWDRQNRNALRIAWIAEDSGIAALSIHGRTRACRFTGAAEYETIKQVKQVVKLPVIANGDINSPKKAKRVLQFTGADAIMIGRAAQGRPWIFAGILHYLIKGKLLQDPPIIEIQALVQNHLDKLYSFYGNETGVRIARKHINHYFNRLGAIPLDTKNKINQALQPKMQQIMVNRAFNFFVNDRAA